MGLSNPHQPNDPDQNGDSEPPDDDNNAIPSSDITAPGTAGGSWQLQVGGTGGSFVPDAGGECVVPDDPPVDGGVPGLPGDPDGGGGGGGGKPCEQASSCSFKVEDGPAQGPSTITLRVISLAPSGGGTTGPDVSANFDQDQQAAPSEWTAVFSSDDEPIAPGCGGESSWAVTWTTTGTPQRWELSFRCSPCEDAPQ